MILINKQHKGETKMKKWKTWVVSGFTLAALTGTAFAGVSGYGGWGLGKKVNCPAYGPPLNWTEEQQKKWNDLREKSFKETVTLRNELYKKRLELRALWAEPQPDRGKILAKQKEINALQEQLQMKLTDARLEARKILTPEQAAQLGSYGAGWGMGFGRGRQGMWGQGPCAGPGPAGRPGWGPGPMGPRF